MAWASCSRSPRSSSTRALRLSRDRRHLLRDGVLLAGVGVLATLVLMVASGLVLGQFDFIRPTIAGEPPT